MVDAIGDDKDLVAFLMWEQSSVWFADDGFYIEIVEDSGLVAFQSMILHIIYRSRNWRSDVGAAFHAV